MNDFQDDLYREFRYTVKRKSNIIKSSESKISGKTRVTVAEDEKDSVKILLKKDQDDSVKELKFICSCGKTKSLILDYPDQ